MKFLITFNHIDGVWDKLTPQEQELHGGQLADFMRALKAEKNAELVFLAPKQQSTTVRIDDDKSLAVHDGPINDDPEYLGGYFIIEADTREEAIDWAKKGRFLIGSNEVRQIIEIGA